MKYHSHHRLAAGAVTLGFMLTLLPQASLFAADAVVFADVSATTPYATAIASLKTKGVISGYAGNTFKPGATINRAEFLKIVLEARGLPVGNDAACFLDVGTEWFAKYICTAKSEGIVSGYPDAHFRPGQSISFVEASKILAGAFKVTSNESSVEWYEPFIKALETTRAIPPSVKGLTHLVTRGEMAELLWRLTEQRTDLASKGYLNLKYPDTGLDFSKNTVQFATRCADLSAFVQEAARSGTSGGMYRTMDAVGDQMGAPAPMAAETDSASKSVDYSQTNVQVEGVDEGDIVKTDGTYVYVINGTNVRIVRAHPGNNMKEESVIAFKDFTPQDLYINGNMLTVLGQSWETSSYPRPIPMMEKSMIAPGYWPPYNKSKAEVRLYDVSNHASPRSVRTVGFDGNTVSTRMIGTKLYMVIQQPMNWYHIMAPNVKATEKDVLPTFDDTKTGNDQAVAKCGQVSIIPHIPQPEYITVAVVPTDSANGEIKREVVVGNAQNIYASLQNLYVAMPKWQYNWNARGAGESSQENTNIYRFSFDSDGVTFKAEGSVPGHILNQFSMDEHENTFRIATNSYQWNETNGKSSNNLFVLNMDLKVSGSITEIAPGESIFSVRFMGDRAYMVTFKQIDPLFVIDTSDPRNPKILGKLKIPGYSNYLHPYDENHVIGFGKEVDESIDQDKVHSDDAVYYTAILGMKISLFDVTDVANPKEKYKVVIGDRGTDSPLLSDHKALLFDKERGLLSFPITVMEIPSDQKSLPPSEQYPSAVFQGAYVYDFTLSGGFKLRGTVTHYDSNEVFDKAGSYWYGTSDISRVLRIENSLISISNTGVRSHNLQTLNAEGKVTFPDDGSYPPVYPMDSME